MHRTTINAILFILSLFASSSFGAGPEEWDLLERQVRDGAVDRKTAKETVRSLHGELKKTYGDRIPRAPFHFPVKRYGPDSIGGVQGSGFVAAGYDFYDGNKHGGHPAHDIFINDLNQDSVDDGTGKPVEIGAFTSGLVVAVNREWTYPSLIRSGKYIWIFHEKQDLYCYYVHLNSISVSVGDLVRAGQTIGTLGRTGKNAYPRRSPTHLHFSCLSFDKGNLTPYNTYPDLLGTAPTQ